MPICFLGLRPWGHSLFLLVRLWVNYRDNIIDTGILYGNTCSHYVVKEYAILVVFHKDRLDKTCHRMSFTNKANRLLQPLLIIHLGEDNRNINITPWIGRAFRIRAI